MSFNIGSQSAGVINNVQGDQTNHGDQNIAIGSPMEARAALAQLRMDVESLTLDTASTTEIAQGLDEMDTELQRSQPDRATLGEHLGRVARILVSTGALVSASHGLGSAISRLAGWLGPHGAAALRLVQG